MLKHVALRLTAVFLITLTLVSPALAWDYRDTLSGNMCVEISVDGQWHELTEIMRYSHENGILADGSLMFMPLETFLAQRELPTFAYTDTFSYRITCPPSVTSYEVSWSIHRRSGAELIPVSNALYALPELEQGVYLMRMYISAEGLSGSCRNECMFWLVIGEAASPATFLPTPTPCPAY